MEWVSLVEKKVKRTEVKSNDLLTEIEKLWKELERIKVEMKVDQGRK